MIGERYNFKTVLDIPYGQAVNKSKAALAGKGLGVLAEIDVKSTLKKKLDVDFRPYVILGACNPSGLQDTSGRGADRVYAPL